MSGIRKNILLVKGTKSDIEKRAESFSFILGD